MSDLITPHDFVDDCDCHQCSLRARDQLRTEVDRLRNIEAAAVVCNDFPEWSGEAFYDSLLDLGKALRGEVGAGGTAVQGDMLLPANALGQEPCAAVCARSPAPMG